MGAALGQVDEEGEEHPVSYFNKKFLPREEKYSAIEKECLAVKLGVQAFRMHLLGWEFVVVTDHRALEWLECMWKDNSRIIQWSLSLQLFHFKIQYRQGKLNGNAEALSRLGGGRIGDSEWTRDSERIRDGGQRKDYIIEERGKVMSGNKLRSFKN